MSRVLFSCIAEQHDIRLIALAAVVCILATAVAAGYVAWLGLAWRYRLLATVRLVAAICGPQFTAIAAVSAIPNPRIAVRDNVVAPGLLAMLVAAGTIGIVILAMFASINS